MRKFIVNVNGASYEVQVEEISGATAAAPVAAPVPAAAAPVAAPAAAPVAATGSQETVNAPMPGTILDIRVKVGDQVKSGQVIMVLEAMKMENEIMAPANGTIVAINTSKGSTVNSGDSLCVIG